jgi:hypothetical protein
LKRTYSDFQNVRFRATFDHRAHFAEFHTPVDFEQVPRLLRYPLVATPGTGESKPEAASMSANLSDYVAIVRTFHDLSDEDIADIEKVTALVKYGWGRGFSWNEVLRSPRVLMISEAGASKTRECRAQRDRLIAAGEFAFFFDLATLATASPRDTLLPEEENSF